jgi:uncharacterized protein (TIGR02453 family)
MPAFSGFDAKTLKFLKEIEKNNNREWFAENKPRYEATVLEPALDFIATMGPHLHKISDHFDAIPKRMGGSLMRVYRDTRFSKDKTPYKTNIGIQFRHQVGKDIHAPGYYMNIAPDNCFIGVGMWHPESGALRAIRERIAEKPKEWQKAIGTKAFRDNYELQGESLVRPPKGFDPEDPNLVDLKRKDFIAVTNFSKDEITSPKFVVDVAKRFGRGTAYMQFLCKAVGVPF